MATQFIMDDLKSVAEKRDELLKLQNKKWIVDSRSYSNLSDSIHINVVGVTDTRIVICYDVCHADDFRGVYVLKNDEMIEIPSLGINKDMKGCNIGLYNTTTLAKFLDKIVDTLTTK